ncbi:hypothetical protein D043_0056A, partial [Vibrio parahaemolyticus EKP-021]
MRKRRIYRWCNLGR